MASIWRKDICSDISPLTLSFQEEKGFSRAKLEEKYEFASFCGHYSSSTFSNTRSFGKFGNIHDCFTGKCTTCKIHTKLNPGSKYSVFPNLISKLRILSLQFH